jgi:2-methylfumaryl-CoA hydratase
VIGLKENSNGRTGVVYVRSTGYKEDGTEVVDYVRWVMVNKRDAGAPAPRTLVPDLPAAVGADVIGNAVPLIDRDAWDDDLAGSRHRFDDYAVGERIDHVDGTTIEEAEHQLATRLYQNTARVHFNQHTEGAGRFGRRLVYGGHVISVARALSFNGLGSGFHVAAINAGRHVAPVFAGDTVYAWSEILAAEEMDGRPDVGALRVRTVAAKNRPCGDFPGSEPAVGHDPAVVLDLDYWLVMPRR